MLNRFAAGRWMPVNHDADGSLDLYVQSQTADRPPSGAVQQRR